MNLLILEGDGIGPEISAATGAVFPLHDKPENKWLLWSPSIAISNATVAVPAGRPASSILNHLNQTSK